MKNGHPGGRNGRFHIHTQSPMGDRDRVFVISSVEEQRSSMIDEVISVAREGRSPAVPIYHGVRAIWDSQGL